MSYPDVVIACIEHKVSLEAFKQLRQRWWSTIIIWRIIPWWLTDHHNLRHSNYLVCDRANTQSVTVRKVVETATPVLQCLVIKWIYNIVLFGGKNAGCSFFITFNWYYALFSDVSLRRQASMTQAEKFPDPFCSRAMLICSIIWLRKRIAGCCSASFCSSLTWGCPRIQCRWFVLSEVVFTLSWCRSINTIPAS